MGDKEVEPFEVFSFSSKNKECTNIHSLIDRFPIQNIQQLAVNPKKVDEVCSKKCIFFLFIFAFVEFLEIFNNFLIP